MQKSMNQSFNLLKEVLPLEFTARVLAQSIYATRNNTGEHGSVRQNCSYFIDQVIWNATIANEICLKYNFSDVKDLKFFINGTWYKGTYLDNVKSFTGMNDTQVA